MTIAKNKRTKLQHILSWLVATSVVKPEVLQVSKMWQNVAADIVIWLIQSVNVVGFCYPKNGGDSVGGGSEGDGGDGGNGCLTVMLAIIITITLP